MLQLYFIVLVLVVQQVLEILPDARPRVNLGLRLVYAYFKDDNKIVFIEMYHKNDKANGIGIEL